MMPKAFLLLLVFPLAGCASLCGGRELRDSRDRLELKDREIGELRQQLVDKEAELKARDQTIEELKSKLRNFGVF